MELTHQGRVLLSGLVEKRLQLLVALLEALDLLALSLPGGLGGAAVSEHALDATLLLFVLGLGSFPVRLLAMGAAMHHGSVPYLGGRLVLGSGNT